MSGRPQVEWKFRLIPMRTTTIGGCLSTPDVWDMKNKSNPALVKVKKFLDRKYSIYSEQQRLAAFQGTCGQGIDGCIEECEERAESCGKNAECFYPDSESDRSYGQQEEDAAHENSHYEYEREEHMENAEDMRGVRNRLQNVDVNSDCNSDELRDAHSQLKSIQDDVPPTETFAEIRQAFSDLDAPVIDDSEDEIDKTRCADNVAYFEKLCSCERDAIKQAHKICTRIPCIYIMQIDDKPIYIGMSHNLRKRFKTHEKLLLVATDIAKRDKAKVGVFAVDVKETPDGEWKTLESIYNNSPDRKIIESVEWNLIRHFRPELNDTGNNPDSTTKLHGQRDKE